MVRHNLNSINQQSGGQTQLEQYQQSGGWSDTTRKSRQEEPQLHPALHLRYFVCSSATDNKFPSQPHLLLLLDGAHLVDVHGGAGPAQAPELGDHGDGGDGGGGHQAHNCEAGPWSGQPLVEAPMGGTTVTRSSRLCRHLLPAATPSSEKKSQRYKSKYPTIRTPRKSGFFFQKVLIFHTNKRAAAA